MYVLNIPYKIQIALRTYFSKLDFYQNVFGRDLKQKGYLSGNITTTSNPEIAPLHNWTLVYYFSMEPFPIFIDPNIFALYRKFPSDSLKSRVSTEFRQHGIPYIFITSVYSVCHTELPKIPRNYTELSTLNFCRIPRNSPELKSLPHKILYSAEFQKVTSVDTLLKRCLFTN
jgi:hypothetical protein